MICSFDQVLQVLCVASKLCEVNVGQAIEVYCEVINHINICLHLLSSWR